MDAQQRSPTYLSLQPTLPPIAALTSDLSAPEPSPGLLRQQQVDTRDSGNWSVSQSKHSSYGSTGLQLHSILNAEDSPSRASMGDVASSTRGSLQPIYPPSMQHFDNRQSIQSVQSAQSAQSLDAISLMDSRRNSVESRMNAGMTHLQISPTSPYDNQTQSRSSLVSTLQQQRGISGEQRLSGSAPLSPLGSRMGIRVQAPPRRAPVINDVRSVSGMPDPTAAAPTKGFPWAFPDHPEETNGRRGSSSVESVSDRVPSRANSFATSINSSIYTADGLPPGQKRFDEDMVHTHHHSLQHRSVSSLQATEGGSTGTGNYSRTPELRVSHKIAERKRRSEMKSLFDELNAILPNSPGGKSSKWEVLTRSIDHMKTLKYQNDCARRDADRNRVDAELVRKYDDENHILRSEVQAMWQYMQRLEPQKPHVFGHFTTELERGQNSPSSSGAPTGMLPPLQSPSTASHWGIQAQSQSVQSQQQPGAPMQGVEYQPSQAQSPIQR